MALQRKSVRTLALIVAVLLVVRLLNPPLDEHLAKLGAVGTPRMPTTEEMTKGITHVISPVDVSYHNYILCSTARRADGGLVSFGILHTVIDLR